MTRPRRLIAAALAMLALAGTGASAQDKVLGLLTLPEVFGNGPCHPFEPLAIDLFAAPRVGERVATIQVDQHWAFAPHGGCEGLKVTVHRQDAREPIPTREFANEAPAAVVLARQDDWFKIQLTGGDAWLKASPRDRFMPMADLFSEYPTLTALTAAHSGALRESPADVAGGGSPPMATGAPVRVLEFRAVAEQTWLRIAVMSHSICDLDSGGPPEVKGVGWVPAHSPAGEPTVWFSSRGCL
jgi:hypothetical protein